MKPETLYEKSTATGRLEVVIKIAGIVAFVIAFFVLMQHGLVLAVMVTLLGLLCLAAGRLLELATDLMNMLGRLEESWNSPPSVTPPETKTDAV